MLKECERKERNNIQEIAILTKRVTELTHSLRNYEEKVECLSSNRFARDSVLDEIADVERLRYDNENYVQATIKCFLVS